MAKPRGPQILTANHLLTGEAVFWTGDGWSPDYHAAEVLHRPEDQQDRLAMAEAAAGTVVGPYLAGVAEGGPAPTHIREIIRTRGPTVRRDLGKQAAAPAVET